MNGSSLRIIYRVSEPTKLDTANYLTLCEVTGEKNIFYIQMSKDCETPDWHYLGILNTELLISLIDKLKDK